MSEEEKNAIKCLTKYIHYKIGEEEYITVDKFVSIQSFAEIISKEVYNYECHTM